MELLTSKLEALLRKPRKISVIAHRNPDGDAIGSALGVFDLLSDKHEVHVIMPSEYPEFFNWMEDINTIDIFDLEQEKCAHKVEQSDLFFFLDFNALGRIDKLGELVEKNKKADRVMIDHHLDPHEIADPMFSDVRSSSTCELVYRVFNEMEGYKLSKKAAEYLYIGILTDTGGLKYGTTPTTFEVVAALNRLGVDNFRMQDLVFNNMDEKQLRILGLSLYKRMEIFPEFHTGIIALSAEDYKKLNIQRGDTEGIVNFILKVNDIKFAVFIREQPTGITKLSFRSRGSFAVNQFASEYFNGGGHKNASGGFSYQKMRSVVRKIKGLLPGLQEELKNAEIYES
jgi:phosphoesterase RecJ-like protein